MAVISTMVPLGTRAPDFSLPSIDGRAITIKDLADAPALLVTFLCNHCPYVRHIEAHLGAALASYAGKGLAVVGICPNDADTYLDDRPEGLAAQVERAGWTFPYLVDETQDVGRAYQAACTPDFFLYGEDRRLAYRGAYDGSTPGNGVTVTGDLLSAAIDHVLRGQPVPEPHKPSMGCSIKWREATG